jgi:hypothetical protein
MICPPTTFAMLSNNDYTQVQVPRSESSATPVEEQMDWSGFTVVPETSPKQKDKVSLVEVAASDGYLEAEEEQGVLDGLDSEVVAETFEHPSEVEPRIKI